MASWSRMAQMPSDLGFSDDGFILPPLNVHTIATENSKPVDGGDLFGSVHLSATNIHDVKRQTSEARALAAADIAMGSDQPCVIWVDTDYEADAVLDRKSVVSGKSVSVRVDLGGRGVIKKKRSIRIAHD